MHFSLITALAVAGTASLVAAQNCNPSFNFTTPDNCISNCNTKAGLEQFSDYTTDPNSPNFIKSLSYRCSKGTPAYTQYMTTSGTCMMSCSKAEQDAFAQIEFGLVCGWYAQHANDTCADPSGTPSSRPVASFSATQTGSMAAHTGAPGKSTDDGAPAPSETPESIASQLTLGSAIVSIAAAGTAALLF